jgi:hypothetical protein
LLTPEEQKRVEELRAGETVRLNKVGMDDSVEKILYNIAKVATGPVLYLRSKQHKTRQYAPQVDAVKVSPTIFKKFTCSGFCNACCQKFTLDYIPEEFPRVPHKEGFEEKSIWVNGKQKTIWTNNQKDNPICDFLRVLKPEGGLGCAEWPHSPLSCASAPQLQFIQMNKGITYVLNKPFGRAWAMTPEPQCEFEEVEDFSEMGLDNTLELVDRFRQWANYLEIETCLDVVYDFILTCYTDKVRPTQAVEVWRKA